MLESRHRDRGRRGVPPRKGAESWLRAAMRLVTGRPECARHRSSGITRNDGTVVVSLAGELDLYNAHEVREALLECCAESPNRLVVDLSGVKFIDSTALGVLIEARTKLAEPARLPARRARPGDETRARDLRPRPPLRGARLARRGARGRRLAPFRQVPRSSENGPPKGDLSRTPRKDRLRAGVFVSASASAAGETS